ncbi:DNA recombination protein RmuC [Cutibacterium acnes JCM 18909]|nr:DNA recombination protein RmuC [Cutibacterium acnes JCM 18909]
MCQTLLGPSWHDEHRGRAYRTSYRCGPGVAHRAIARVPAHCRSHLGGTCGYRAAGSSREDRHRSRRLATQFKALSAQTMADQNERATRSAQRTMSDAQRLLAPVSLALERLDRRLAEVEQERTDMTASLREQVAGVSTAGESLRKETASLVAALRKPQIRGAWGEMQLQRTAEVAGMLEHCDFQTQQTTTAQGAPQRPDMTVKLPGGRCIHVDAKTPLAAFLEAAQCDDAEEYDARWPVSHAMFAPTSTSSRPRLLAHRPRLPRVRRVLPAFRCLASGCTAGDTRPPRVRQPTRDRAGQPVSTHPDATHGRPSLAAGGRREICDRSRSTKTRPSQASRNPGRQPRQDGTIPDLDGASLQFGPG